MVIHDLRRTVRTGLSDLGGIPDAVAELCLNHRPKGVAGVYDRAERIQERAWALQRWADHVEKICAGSNVVNLKVASA
jgi:integrase